MAGLGKTDSHRLLAQLPLLCGGYLFLQGMLTSKQHQYENSVACSWLTPVILDVMFALLNSYLDAKGMCMYCSLRNSFVLLLKIRSRNKASEKSPRRPQKGDQCKWRGIWGATCPCPSCPSWRGVCWAPRVCCSSPSLEVEHRTFTLCPCLSQHVQVGRQGKTPDSRSSSVKNSSLNNS